MAKSVKEEHPFFEKKYEVFRGTFESLRVFLQSRLQPWRWPVMLKHGGIRVEEERKNVEPLTLDYQLSAGNVVYTNDAAGKTWPALIREATENCRDLVFCPQRSPRDQFLTDQYDALMADPRAQAVPEDVVHLYGLVESLIRIADHPIRHLILVSHATEFGEILMPMRKATADDVDPEADDPDPNARAITWESLGEAIALGKGQGLQIDGRSPNPVVLPRPENKHGKFIPCAVIVRGCSSGVHTILLERIQAAFGYMVDTVVMPKYFDAVSFFGKRSATDFDAAIEFFQHNLLVSSKTPLSRDKVIEAFQNAKLSDWLGNRIPDSDWEDLVPQTLTPGTTVDTKDMSVRVEGRQNPFLLKAHFDCQRLSPATKYMTQKTKPTSAEIETFLNASWDRLPAFMDKTWPFWMRVGVGSARALRDFWTYEIHEGAKKKKGQWAVRGIRYRYVVRTPLIEKDRLVANYIPRREKGTATNLINYNDTRIFGRVNRSVTKKDEGNKDNPFPAGWSPTI